MEDDIQQQLGAKRYGEAFELLLEQFQDKVFRLAFSMLRNETAAEDVAQDVFVKIWRALPAHQGGGAVSSWIYTITRNTCLTELRKRAIRPTVSLQEPELEAVADSIPALQSASPAPGADMDVEALLSGLPEKYRRVLTLFYLEQHAYEEVATMLGLPLGTVKTLLFRAKKQLLHRTARGQNIPAHRPGSARTEIATKPEQPASGPLPGVRAAPLMMIL